MQWTVETASSAETLALGRLLGQLLEPPAIFLLSGDLGAGKTCLVQGLARGLGVPEEEPVTSPSYTLLNIYSGRCQLYHFDLYRLAQAEDLLDLGFEDYLDADGVTVVEWADRIPDLPAGGLHLHLRHSGEECRRLTFTTVEDRYRRLLAALQRHWQERGREK